MLPLTVLARVTPIQPLLDTVERAASALPGEQVFERLLPGQKLPAQVVAFSNSLARVRVAESLFAMRLPAAYQVGDTLELTFLSRQPQPTFQLATGSGAPLQIAARQVGSPATDAYARSARATPGLALEISDAPRLSPVARYLGATIADHPPGTPAALVPAAPLLPRPADNPAAMASALQGSVTRSGLFYESHLAAWIDGRDTLDGLLREPQNRALAQPAANLPLPTVRAQADTAAPASTTSRPGSAASGLADAAPDLPDAAPRALIAQQLQVLETPALVWRGELWPGQPLEWQLARTAVEDDARRLPTDAAPDQGWTSTLKLELPRLGTVEVVMALDGAGEFRIRLLAAPATRDILGGGSPDVLAALAAAGCRVNDWQVLAEAAPETVRPVHEDTRHGEPPA